MVPQHFKNAPKPKKQPTDDDFFKIIEDDVERAGITATKSAWKSPAQRRSGPGSHTRLFLKSLCFVREKQVHFPFVDASFSQLRPLIHCSVIPALPLYHERAVMAGCAWIDRFPISTPRS